MSSLDQAFIKAYTRNPAAQPSAPAAYAPPAMTAEPAVAYPEPQSGAEPLDAWYGAGVRYRLDEPHLVANQPNVGPHPHLPPQAYADLAYVNPYYPVQAVAPAVPAAATPQLDTATSGLAMPGHDAPPAPHFVANPAPVARSTPASTEETRPATQTRTTTPQKDRVASETLRTAATVQLPAPLELPSLFRGPQAAGAPADAANAAFAPDWEVDQFVWPEVCEHLLATEATYFRHVGERLAEATAKHHYVLLITGSRRGEGRTTLALCLARCAAQAGVPLALWDADLANPQLGERLGMEIPCGWSEVWRGRAPLNEAAVASVADRLTLFPLAAGESGAVEVTPGDERLQTLLREVSGHYPLVIIDGGPLGTDESHLFSGEGVCPINAAMVVRDRRYTTERKVHLIAEQLLQSGIPAVGIAENFCHE